MPKEMIKTPHAPAALGPYSQGVKVGNLIYTAGQLGLDPATGKLVEGLEAQTEQALQNLAAILQAAGSRLENVIKTTCFLADINDFKAFNGVYARYFTANPPARSTVQAGALPAAGLVEIEVVALIE